MLIIGRKSGECISIALAESTDPSMRATALFSAGPIEFKLLRVTGQRATIGVSAPDDLIVWRGAIIATDDNPDEE